MSSRLTKKSLVSVPGLAVSTPACEPPWFAPSTRRPPTSTVISGAERPSRLALSISRYSDGSGVALPPKLRKPSTTGSSTANDSASVCSCVASARPGRNGTSTSWPAALAACSIAAAPPRTIRSASETFLPPVAELLNASCTPSRTRSTWARSVGSLTSQLRCGSRRMRAPLAPPRLSLWRNDEAEAHAVLTSCEIERPVSRILAFSEATSSAETSSWSTTGRRSCQISSSCGTCAPR